MADAGSNPIGVSPAEDSAVKAVNKRYEGLVSVRTKAIRGKGAWYWAHFEPVLIRNPDTNLPKAVKLRCNLCEASFSASNPSRTASEHLKKGSCPNFSTVVSPFSSAASPSLPPLASPSSQRHRKRISNPTGTSSSSYQAIAHQAHAMADSSSMGYSQALTVLQTPAARGQQQHLVLSGGKEDLGPLAMLEDSVKKLKSPKASPGPALTKNQVDSALELLADWVYESCGAVAFSSIEHPKFKSFLTHLGLPAISSRELTGSRLDSKFQEAKMESEARLRDAAFFQISSDGWKSSSDCGCKEGNLIKFMANLPNGTTVFLKSVFAAASVQSQYAEQIMLETVTEISGHYAQKCAGIVADKFKSTALKNLEAQNPWMVNLSCQFQAFINLIHDFNKQHPLFKSVANNCLKIAKFCNNKPQIRNNFHKLGFIRVPPSPPLDKPYNHDQSFAMIEDILRHSRTLHSIVTVDSFKAICAEDPTAREVGDMIRDMGFWNEINAVHSLVKMIREMAGDIEFERPSIAQCIPLWEELTARIKTWCTRFSLPEPPIETIVGRRFRKNYHPSWSAAYILDPLYLLGDNNGKYLPPFNRLNQEQEKDVDRVITRLVPREEAPLALMELLKWRSDGLDPLYAQAVQVRQRDPSTGKMKIANPQSRRIVWETCLKEFRSLSRVAVRLLFMQATTRGVKCNLHGNSRAEKVMFLAAQARLERGDFGSEEERDKELFGGADRSEEEEEEEEEMLDEVFADV